MAYTISRSERRDTPAELLRVFQYDQTHIFTILGSWAFGDGFRLGARFRLVSGGLYTPFAAGGVLAMLAESMIPEAFADAQPFIGLITVVGFLVAFLIIKMPG